MGEIYIYLKYNISQLIHFFNNEKVDILWSADDPMTDSSSMISNLQVSDRCIGYPINRDSPIRYL